MLKIDLHVHSLASGHAFNTIFELATYAKKAGVETIAITDHGPSMEGASHLGYFEVLTRLPKVIEGVNILIGCEANVINFDGNIDIPMEIQESLDLVIVGLHRRTPYPESADVSENTNALLRAIEKNKVHIIAHPYRSIYPTDLKRLSEVACRKGIFLEVNLSLLSICREDELRQVRLMLETVSSLNGKVTISSDAHVATEIGDDSVLKKLSLNIPGNLVFGYKEEYEDIRKQFA